MSCESSAANDKQVYNFIVTRTGFLLIRTLARGLAFACALLIPTIAVAQTPQPLQGSSTRAGQYEELENPRPIFALHSGFWLNLHLYLYEQARLKEVQTAAAPDGRGGSAKNRESDSAAWQSAVAYYEKNFAEPPRPSGAAAV